MRSCCGLIGTVISAGPSLLEPCTLNALIVSLTILTHTLDISLRVIWVPSPRVLPTNWPLLLLLRLQNRGSKQQVGQSRGSGTFADGSRDQVDSPCLLRSLGQSCFLVTITCRQTFVPLHAVFTTYPRNAVASIRNAQHPLMLTIGHFQLRHFQIRHLPQGSPKSCLPNPVLSLVLCSPANGCTYF